MTRSKCPICAKPTDTTYRPFCSKRCSDVDLQRWLKGSYAVPAVDDDTRSEEAGDGDASRLDFE